jgi:hypothetical protein
MGVLKLPTLGLLRLWRLITLCDDLWLRSGLNQSCSPCQELFNGMSHVTCTQGNLVDSWLSVVGSQTANLTPNLSFGHNLCFRCPNGSCEPILNMCVSITFQWYKELFKAMGLDPCDCSLKIWESIGTRTPQSVSFPWSVCEGLFPHTLLHSKGSLLACNLATSCLSREPKAKVVTPYFDNQNRYLCLWW